MVASVGLNRMMPKNKRFQRGQIALPFIDDDEN